MKLDCQSTNPLPSVQIIVDILQIVLLKRTTSAQSTLTYSTISSRNMWNWAMSDSSTFQQLKIQLIYSPSHYQEIHYENLWTTWNSTQSQWMHQFRGSIEVGLMHIGRTAGMDTSVIPCTDTPSWYATSPFLSVTTRQPALFYICI